MHKAILGVNLFGHDTAAALVRKDDGEIIHAVAEERLSNIKHSSIFPVGAIDACRKAAEASDLKITDVAVNYDELEFLRGVLMNELTVIAGPAKASRIIDMIENALPGADYYSLTRPDATTWLIERILASNFAAPADRMLARARIFFYFNWTVKYRALAARLHSLFPGTSLHKVAHHLCHAVSAYGNSGFDDATVMTIDGQGESETLCIFHAKGNSLKKISSTLMPHSLGHFYLAATDWLGFKLGDEYKVMGMAAYGEPRFLDYLTAIIHTRPDATMEFRETSYFKRKNLIRAPGHFIMCLDKSFNSIIARRKDGDEIRQVHFDFACSVQRIAEKTGTEIARAAMALTGSTRLAMAGGVALNGLMNEQIRLHSGCTDLFIYPAASDDGTAAGAAQYIVFAEGRLNRKNISSVFYGSCCPANAQCKILEEYKIVYEQPKDIHSRIAEALADNKIVARYVGRSEFGPRALGNRSILANPCNPDMKDILNARIKHREPFRPFAPACLSDQAPTLFNINISAPFMLLIPTVKESAWKTLPAVVHNDKTARLQTVSAVDNPVFHRTIINFQKLTGVPVVINTSFNVNGEAIVETPLDAIESFGHMDIDYLALENCWVDKHQNINTLGHLTGPDFLERRKSRFKEAFSSHESKIDIARLKFITAAHILIFALFFKYGICANWHLFFALFGKKQNGIEL